ncbi:transglycosylase family protein [Pseudonocardia sp. HH130630-07]|uniref:transglycosylase family protein n=1 Tax=Pseudonocardia sp. HH130630-07 TaxID=1690815 RepID=UPI000B1E2565|nr:transglycosylase family protein [Pseudonocardia sp. HH130630-07]
MRRSRKPYWAEHVPRRWDGTALRRSTIAVLTTSTLIGLTAFAVGTSTDEVTADACTGATRDQARTLLADAALNDDPRAQDLARQLAGLGLTPATRPAGWQQLAVDVSDQLNGTTDPRLRAVAVKLAAAGYGPTPSDLMTRPAAGSAAPEDGAAPIVDLPEGCVDRVASTGQAPEPPGADGSTTGLLGELVDQLSASNDTEATALSDAISSAVVPAAEAVVPEQVIDLQFDPADLEEAPEAAAPEPEATTGTGSGSTDGGTADSTETSTGTSTDGTTGGWQDGARALVAQVDAAAATDPLAAELATTLDRLELLPDTGKRAATDGATAPGAAAWEAGAERLAAQVTAAVDVDPLAKVLADRLTAAGFAAPAQDSTSDSDSSGSDSSGSGDTTSRDSDSGTDSDSGSGSDSASDSDSGSDSDSDADSRDSGSDGGSGSERDSGSSGSGSGNDAAERTTGGSAARSTPAEGAGDTAGEDIVRPGSRAATAPKPVEPAPAADPAPIRAPAADPSKGVPLEPVPGAATEGAAPWETGAALLVDEVTEAAGKDPLARELADKLTAAGFGSGRGAVQGATWDKLAQCESGGDWTIDTGNGYSGGLQFAPATWEAFGGSGPAHQASRTEQISVAEKVLAAQGWEAWPACSAELGLRGTPS